MNDMKEAARLLNDMVMQGVISAYAVFGAVAQMRYTEAIATLDIDVLVAIPDPDRMDVLAPIYEFCRSRGYLPKERPFVSGHGLSSFFPLLTTLRWRRCIAPKRTKWMACHCGLWDPTTLP